MTVRTRVEPAELVPPGFRCLTVWGPAAEVGQWLDQADGVEWVSRPQAYGAYIVVRVRVRHQLISGTMVPEISTRSHEVERVSSRWLPWWREPSKVALACTAVTAVVAVVGVAAWLVVSAVTAAVTWTAANWPLIVAIAVVTGAAYLLLRRRKSSGGGCGGLHCTGCRHH